MTATVLILIAVIGFFIAVLIYFKGNKSFLAYIVGIMSVLLLVGGFYGYKEIKKDANTYYPAAVQWLESQNANYAGALSNFSVYCIYYASDSSRAVVYVELPSSKDNLVMVFNRANKSLDEVNYIPKSAKPVQDFQNKLNPSIFFY